MPSTSAHPSTGRYGKSTAVPAYGGYNPPNFARERYSYSDKGPEESNTFILIYLHEIFVFFKIHI